LNALFLIRTIRQIDIAQIDTFTNVSVLSYLETS